MAALLDLTRPRAVDVAFWCWFAGSLLVGAIVGLLSTRTEPMRAEFARLAAAGDPAATTATIDRVTAASVLTVIGTGALLGVLGLVVAGLMRAGRNWARVVLVVLALVGVVYTAFCATSLTAPMLGDRNGLVSAGLLIYTGTILTGVVGMFAPGTKAWFHRPTARH
jgi:hypothetical protein